MTGDGMIYNVTQTSSDNNCDKIDFPIDLT